MSKKKAIIIGGGFAGCTAAHMVKEKGFDVTILEGSSELGGGCRTMFHHGHPYTYGPHHLLINNDEMYVWDYFSKFLNLRELQHKTLTFTEQDSAFYSYPIHVDDIANMPDTKKINEQLDNRGEISSSKNFEEYWINSVGENLYDKFVNTYSKKMWQLDDNKEIDEFSFSPKGVAIKEGSRICFDGQKVIAYPTEFDAYNSYFIKATEGCDVRFNSWITEFDIAHKRVNVADEWLSADVIVNTASVDSIFDYCYGELKYVGRDFMKIILPVEHAMPDDIHFIHYAGNEPYTRIVEYKQLTGYQSPHTLIGIESPSFKNKLYPYPIKSEIAKAKKYLDDLPDDVYSIGRMGRYHYDNMDIIVKDCMKQFKSL